MDYHQRLTLARLAFRRSTASFIFLHTIHQLKLLKAYLVGIQWWILYWSNCLFFSQQYQVPGSNVTIDEAMILFTGREIHITKMPNKPISQEYKFFCRAVKGDVWEFHPSSNAVGRDPPVIVHAYNQHKVGVDVADQYQTYFDTQLISRRNWYPLSIGFSRHLLSTAL